MKPSVLLQLDCDSQPSVFDAIVAIDAGAEHLLSHGGVTPDNVRGLVHGALFTRGLGDLSRTAIFVGGSDVTAAEELLEAVKASFFGPFRVSVLLDANGANTTSAAAVLAALDGMGGSLQGVEVAVLGGTGPVGRRIARLCAREGARVRIGSRSLERAQTSAESVAAATNVEVTAFSNAGDDAVASGLEGAQVVFAAGAAGAFLLPLAVRQSLASLRVILDLNAVPPLGIEGIDPGDKRTNREGVLSWGALGIGGTKMKIHKRAIQELFTANDRVIDAEECLAIGHALAS